MFNDTVEHEQKLVRQVEARRMRIYRKLPSVKLKMMLDRLKVVEYKAGCKRSLTCQVCQKVCNTFYDHDHITGKFRGWLCGQCNSALGMVHDSPTRLNKLAEYLLYHSKI